MWGTDGIARGPYLFFIVEHVVVRPALDHHLGGSGGGGGVGTTKSVGLSERVPRASESRTRPVPAPAGTVTASSVLESITGFTAATRAALRPAELTW